MPAFAATSCSCRMGAIIIVILAIDVKFRKNRHRLLASTYLDPRGLRHRPGEGHAGADARRNRAEAEGCRRSSWPDRSTGRRTCCSTTPATSIAAAATATSGASPRPTTPRPRSSPRSAAGRSGSPSTGRAASSPASPAWGWCASPWTAAVELLTDQTERSLFSDPGRHGDPHGRRSRHRAGRNDLLHRRDQALRHRELGARPPGGAAERTPAQSYDPATRKTRTVCDNLRLSERRLPDA